MHLNSREIKRSLFWGFLIGTLVMLFGILFARAAAESSGLFAVIYRVLLAPSMSVGLVESKLLGSELSTPVALALGLFLHYTAYFFIVLGVRFVYRQLIEKKG